MIWFYLTVICSVAVLTAFLILTGLIWAGLFNMTITYKHQDLYGRCQRCRQHIKTRRFYFGAGRIEAQWHPFCQRRQDP